MTTDTSPRRATAYGAAALALALCLSVPTAYATATDPGTVVPAPPEPAGPHAVGRADVHLVDPGRGHPWVEGATDRDLMLSFWYPAEPDGERAPYLTPSLGQALTAGFESYGIPRSAVDYDAARANALADADVASGAGPLPVVLFSPGFGMSRLLNTANAEELASHGYVVVSTDHPYETLAVDLPDGRVLRGSAPDLGTETYRQAIGVRVADTRLVLDTLDDLADGGADAVAEELPPGLPDALDTERLGMFGHSAGGLTTAEVMLVDDRVDAGMDLDGSIGYHVGDEVWADSTTRGVDRPFAYLGAGVSGDREYPHTSEHSPDLRLFREASTGPFLELYMPDGEHMSYTDHQWGIPELTRLHPADDEPWSGTVARGVSTVDPRESVDAQRAYIRAFFDAHLLGEDAPLLDGPSPEYPVMEFVD